MSGWFVKRGKYRNVKQTYDGRSFDSGYERQVYQHLLLLEKTGKIKFLRQQCTVRFEFDDIDFDISYRADFEIEEQLDDGSYRRVLVEAKGFEDAVWKLKLKLYRKIGHCPLWIFKGLKSGQPKLHEIVIPSHGIKS